MKVDERWGRLVHEYYVYHYTTGSFPEVLRISHHYTQTRLNKIFQLISQGSSIKIYTNICNVQRGITSQTFSQIIQHSCN
jgi:hypothetical protein